MKLRELSCWLSRYYAMLSKRPTNVSLVSFPFRVPRRMTCTTRSQKAKYDDVIVRIGFTEDIGLPKSFPRSPFEKT